MLEGVSEGSRYGSGWVTFSSISCRHFSRDLYVLLECLMCHCMSTKVESNPSRKIPLLGIAHPIEGKKLFQVPKVHPRIGRIRGRRGEEFPYMALLCILVKIWVEDPVLDKL